MTERRLISATSKNGRRQVVPCTPRETWSVISHFPRRCGHPTAITRSMGRLYTRELVRRAGRVYTSTRGCARVVWDCVVTAHGRRSRSAHCVDQRDTIYLGTPRTAIRAKTQVIDRASCVMLQTARRQCQRPNTSPRWLASAYACTYLCPAHVPLERQSSESVLTQASY